MMHQCSLSLSLALLVVLVTAISAVVVTAISDEATFSNCDLTDYYITLPSDIGSWNRNNIGYLLKSTHRRMLQYTSSSQVDVWDALKDLDPGTTDGTVRLIYKQTDVDANNHGTASTWNREHVWPKSRGVGYNGHDMTDIHHLKPADWNVNAARGNKVFSECGIARDQSECSSPAHSEADSTTSVDPETWLPPENVRGDIARMLFYMDLRYYGDGEDPNLELTDCPAVASGSMQMGYLSQLLDWHVADPVDDEERSRNNKACGVWQGNRNIFVDYPELATQIYGTAQTPLPNGQGYSQCHPPIPTPSPTSTPEPTASPVGISVPVDPATCSDLGAGDVQIVGVASDNPDMVALVALEKLPAGLELFVTENAWMGSSFRSGEGTKKLTVPTTGIAKGTVFGFGEASLELSDSWVGAGGTFALSVSADSVIVYCEPSGTGTYNHLAALEYASGGWKAAGLTASQYGTGGSALPSALIGYSIDLAHKDNYIYSGPTSGTKSELTGYITDSTNWSGSNTRGTYSFSTLTVNNGRRMLLRGAR